MTQDIDKRLQGALLRIRGDHPFFGTLALFAEFRISDAVATAATDGKILWFNPDFTARQNPAQLCGLIVHELLHAALQHLPRRRERDPLLWNIAADIVVNGMVASDTSYTLPEGGVENAKLAHLSVEEIYEKLITGKLKVPKLGLVDLLAGGDHTAIGEEQEAELQRHWRAALQQAGAVARRIGKGFGRDGLDSLRDITEATAPSLNWREILWQFLVSTPCDFSGFDRRFIWQKLYLEDVVGESVEVAIVLDTSGSIGNDELGAFMGEIQGILDAYPQIQGQLFFADAELYGPHPFNQHAAIPAPKGGGGTSFVPFFNWVQKEQDLGNVPLCIYFTDGYGEFPRQAPDVPVLWVVVAGGLESAGFPFGQIARMGA
ncbi:MAG: VWA-like domain-containing protein [Pseudomonadota bacterium]